MTTTTCRLPHELTEDIERHAQDVDRFLKGDLSASILKSRRVPRGIYEQRRDGAFMVRIRIPGGALSVGQARTLAEVASRYGNGILHVTTRQDIQIHEVGIEQTPAILRELLPAGLTAKGGGGNTVRNVTTCPYAGVCPAERFDVTACARAVTEHLIGLKGSYNLPRKYKIAFSGCSADCALAQVNDLGFIARVRDGVPGFAVWAGGGLGAESRVGAQMEDWVPATESVRIAEAVRRLFDRLGDRRNRRRARLRFVLERIGAAAFRELLRETIPAVCADGTPACNAALELVAAPVAAPSDYRELLTQAEGGTVLRQRQPGYVAVPLGLPLGQIAWQGLRALADLSERFSGEKMLRTTQNQDIMLRFVRPSDLAALRLARNRLPGSDPAAPTTLEAFTACTGASTCRLGLCLSQNAARACAEALASTKDLDLDLIRTADIRINGCPNACGQHPIGAIGLFGIAQRMDQRLVPAYRVLLGALHTEGRARLGEPVGTVPARRLPAFLAGLLQAYQAQRHPREAFADFVERIGRPYFSALISRYSDIPLPADDPEFFRDWGLDTDFSLTGRGAGECGAGVFDVIAEDLAAAAKALKAAQSEGANPGAVLFEALLGTTRALLITRGIDSQDPDTILRSFEIHFIATGLVAAEFSGLLTRARGYLEGWRNALDDRREDIRRLLDGIEQLYATMDADLRFHVPEAASPAKPTPPPAVADAPSTEVATAEINLQGVACPMNFVKAKLQLETMHIGDTLAILLDDGEPIHNVPASFRHEGQEVLDICGVDANHWRVVIRKLK